MTRIRLLAATLAAALIAAPAAAVVPAPALLATTPADETEIDAPLGVFLPAGVEVKIDGAEIGRAAFQVCDSRACIASEPVPADFIEKMKKGNAATMTITALNGEKAEIAISLSGFTRGFNDL